jgi:ketosteroid isomerase-like protein
VLTILALPIIAPTAHSAATGAATRTSAAPATAAPTAAATPANTAPPAAPTQDRTAVDPNVAREIERLEQQLITAIEAKDFATYQNLVAEDYVAVGAAGEQTRAQAIEAYRSGALSLPGLKIGDIKVHVYGDTAMISARTFGDRVEKGKSVPNRVRYMRIWMKRQGRWRAVAQMARPLESE